MEFRISDSFTESLSKLTGDEQKAVKTTAFDLQMNPVNPGMQLHRVDRARDPNFWSARVNRDIRLIIHRTDSSLLLCYVDHHDVAYAWAQRRRIERHPKTGAAQLVEIREVVREVPVVRYVAQDAPVDASRLLFRDVSDDELLAFGVPKDWLPDVREATEDGVLRLAERLPGEAAEALLAFAVGDKPAPAVALAETEDAFEHPDAQRRFRTVADAEELERALEYPWERWSIFLHPSQRELVEMEFGGPARVSGSAGTGKTVVAVHRAVHLARHDPDARVLLTTFSEPLANALRVKVRRLIGRKPLLAERIEVHALDTVAYRLYRMRFGEPELVDAAAVRELITEESEGIDDPRLTPAFLFHEWQQVVDAWQLRRWADYRDVPRLGRRVRLSEGQRGNAWTVFERVLTRLQEEERTTHAQLLRTLGDALVEEEHAPYRFVIVDEAQDVSVAQLRFLGALASDEPDSLFFAGDLGQRIYQQPFSWQTLGVDVRGRCHTLKLNYRTSHQIRAQVDRLLPSEISDVDGITERRSGAVSLFNGPAPVIETFPDEDAEASAVGAWVRKRVGSGMRPEEIAVFVRSEAELDRARRALADADVGYVEMDERLATTADRASITTMHLAKGLEFRAVAVMACDDEILPLQSRIETVAEESELEEVYHTERHLLYVACTRAREELLVIGVEPASEFLEDLR